VLTLIWAALTAMAGYDTVWLSYVSIAETLRTAGWIAFLVSLLSKLWRLSERTSYAFILSLVVWFVFAGLIIMDLAGQLGLVRDFDAAAGSLVPLFIMGRLVSAVGGLALVENLYRNTPQNNRWGILMLCLGLGGMFAYDIVLYAQGLLFRSLDQDLYNARGVVNALIVPLIGIAAARNPSWKIDVYLSRRIVFHTLSLMATGLYLMLMAGAGYYLREFGGEWGNLLLASFLFAAFIGLVVILSSGQMRARARVFMAKHFFDYKYEYRDEWLRFIRTVSGAGVDNEGLETRVIRAVCDILDAPGGVLWLRGEDGVYAPAQRWNYGSSIAGREAEDGDFIRFMADRRWIINLHDMRNDAPDYDGMPAPSWAADNPRTWLALPLFHNDRLIGFVEVEEARAPRPLNWEDFDLLKTVGRQVASYLAEKQSQEALANAAQFDAFNRRFAFIIHDLKNLVSQLSLIARNAEKHADNPEFQRDMLLTLTASVDKMNAMLAKLNRTSEVPRSDEAVDVGQVLNEVARAKQAHHANLTIACDLDGCRVRGDRDKLEQVFAHLIQNAIDACDAGQEVRVAGRRDADTLVVDIEDRGCGMSEEFVRKDLFKPFTSTKDSGFGIGAYEARSFIVAMGGRMDVVSRLEEGTRIRVTLPIAPAGQAA